MYPILQKALFEKCGVFFERKRGEFSDGLRAGYIDRRKILERNLFLRVFLASRGDLREAGKKRIFIQHKLTLNELADAAALDVFADAFDLFNAIAPRNASNNVNNAKRYRDVLAKLYIGVAKTDRSAPVADRIAIIDSLWGRLLRLAAASGKHIRHVLDEGTGERRKAFAPEKWMTSADFDYDVITFIKTGSLIPRKKTPEAEAEQMR
ncbi:hypothetical protein CI1B_15490 [Bradyrhizobium ivorense]|uniref:Uncharacterized protein n=2 Tax=Bradyrhizobium ivorense TaxID=2511166 RepID=A0A508SZH8_9BRAD|nr:hypothetical protein CI1B_15490 [Bradyrhizobium ivorense]